MSAQTTSGLSGEVMTFYESEFLRRSEDTQVHKEGLQMGRHGKNQGKSVVYNRYTPLTRVTTPLTEGSNPSEVSLTASQVTSTLAEYGNVVKIAKLLSLVSIDKDGEEKVQVMGQNKGETLDRLTRDALTGGATVSYAGAKTALSDVAASNTMNATEIRKVRRTLIKNKAIKYKNGMFMAKIGPDTEYDIMGDTTWSNAHTYKDGDAMYKGYIGNFFGFDFLVSTDPKSESSTVEVYSNIFHGQHAAGCLELEGDAPSLYIKTPGPQDTSNPTDRYSTIGWAGTYDAEALVAAWIINHKSAVSS